jgi:hypothetical protein
MHNEGAIEFLKSLDHRAAVFIFTKHDADEMCHPDKEITDEAWETIVHDMSNALPDDCWWEYFQCFVNDNAKDKTNGT